MLRFVAVVLVVVSVTATAPAQPLADRVSQEAVIYLGWRGSSQLGPGYEASHLKAVLDASRLREVFSDFLPRLSRKLAEEDEDAGELMESVTSVASILFRHPTAFTFAGLDENGMPLLTLVCRAGEEAAALRERLDALLELADVPLPVNTFIDDDLTGIAIGYEDGAKAHASEDVPGSALSASEGFSTTIERMQADPVVVLYVDTQRMLKLIDRLVAENEDESAAAQWAQLRVASGLAGVRRVVHTAAFEGKNWVTYTLIDVPAPRRGLLSMLDSASLPDELLKAIPSTATFAAGGGFDLAKLVSQVRQVVGAVDPDAQREMEKGLGAASMAIGRNVQKDILEPLGEHWVSYIAPNVGGNGILGLVVVNQLDDVKKAQQGLQALWVFSQNLLASQMQDEEVSIRGLRTTIGGITADYLGIPFVAPSWSIKEGRLYLTMFPQVIASAVEQAGEKSIMDNDRFAKILQRLTPENRKLTGFSYIDLEATAPELYQSWLTVARLAFGFADMFGVQAPEPVIPPLHVLLSHLSPAGAVSWVDESGWHRKSITPFPGATMMASQQFAAVGGTALGASVLLPSLNRARETANRVKCSSNMWQISQAMSQYAIENNGEYPPDLGTLILAGEIDLTIDVFVCPSGASAVPAVIRNAPREQQAEWVNQNADYVYLGDGKRSDLPADEPLLHEHLYNHDGEGVNMLFGDGHVEFVPQFMIDEYLQHGGT
jgi:prepilin-type processing-associated H-X9-DG protein